MTTYIKYVVQFRTKNDSSIWNQWHDVAKDDKPEPIERYYKAMAKPYWPSIEYQMVKRTITETDEVIGG